MDYWKTLTNLIENINTNIAWRNLMYSMRSMCLCAFVNVYGFECIFCVLVFGCFNELQTIYL